jgi:hypothetical protein
VANALGASVQIGADLPDADPPGAQPASRRSKAAAQETHLSTPYLSIRFKVNAPLEYYLYDDFNIHKSLRQ